MRRWATGLFGLLGVSFALVSPAADFDGDGTADVGVYRPCADGELLYPEAYGYRGEMMAAHRP